MVKEKFLTREYGAGETITTPAIPFPYSDASVFDFIQWDLPQDNKMPELERGEELEVNAHFTTKPFVATVRWAPWLNSSYISFDKQYVIYGDEDIDPDIQFGQNDVQYDILNNYTNWIDTSNNIGYLPYFTVSGRRYRYDTSTSSYKNYVETENALLPQSGYIFNSSIGYDVYHDRCLGNVTMWRGSTFTLQNASITLENYSGQMYDLELKTESYPVYTYISLQDQRASLEDSSSFSPQTYLYNCYEPENYYGDRTLQTRIVTVPKSVCSRTDLQNPAFNPMIDPQHTDSIVNGEIRRTYSSWIFPYLYSKTSVPDRPDNCKLILTIKDANGTVLYKNYGPYNQNPETTDGWLKLRKYITDQTTSITIRSVYIWNYSDPRNTDRARYYDYDQTTLIWNKDGDLTQIDHPDYPSSLLNGKRFVRWESFERGNVRGAYGNYAYINYYAILEEV